MKRKLFLLLCALLTLVGATQVKAQPTASALSAGKFYLYNVGAGKYIAMGGAYGTAGALSTSDAVLFTTQQVTEGSVYKLITNVVASGRGVFFNASNIFYVDNGSPIDFTFVKQGDDNIYKIYNGDKYVKWDGTSDVIIGAAADASGDNDKWMLVTRDNAISYLKSQMASARVSSPVDATMLLVCPIMNYGYENLVKAAWDGSLTYGQDQGPSHGTGIAETWATSSDVRQTISTPPAGSYKVKCKGFSRAGNWSDDYPLTHKDQTNGQLYVTCGGNTKYDLLPSIFNGVQDVKRNNKDHQITQDGDYKNKWVPDNATGAALYYRNGYYNDNWAEVSFNTSSNVDICVGFRNNGSPYSEQWEWNTVNRFEIEYYGPDRLENTAAELPANGEIVADTWYYYDVPTTDEYEFTSSDATTLTYTTDGVQLVSEATGTNETFTADQAKYINLTTGHLYFKTSEATTLSISYKYIVGTATIDKSYIQPGQEVTVTWADATTTDPSASFAKNGTPNITFNGSSVDIETTAKGFSFTVPGGLTANTEYTLAIPAGAFGYAAGSTYNAAQEFTLKTPAVYDGTYFLTTTVSEKTKYLSRMTSNDASVDNFGLGFNLTTDKDGVSFIQFLENENYYLDDNNNYKVATKTKRGANTNKWVIVAVAGGYKVRLQANTNCELTVANTTTGKVEITHGTQNGYVWNFITPEAHETAMQAWVDAQAAIAATGAGISATTKAALETAISGYEALAIALPEGYNVSGVQDKFQAGGDLFAEKTLTGLTNGLYKLSLYGYQRISSNVITYAAYGKNAGIGVEYLQANGQQTRMMSVMDVASDEAWDSKDYHGDNGKYYPNNTTGAKAAFDAGKYANDVYVYVSNGTLSYKLYNPSNPQCENWCPYYTFSLTLYSDGMPDVDISTLAAKPMNAETKTALNNASATYDGSKTTANYSALQTAIFNAEASVVVYETIDAAITKVEAWSVTTAAAGIRSKYNSGTYSNETTAANIYAEYQAAEISALAADGSAVDWTSVILNASFETGDMTGWTAESRTDTGVKDQSNGTYSITSGDPVDGLKLFNSWGGTAENNVYQTIKNLPAGAYTLTALVAGFKDEQLILAANETTNSVTVTGDKTVGYTVEVKFTLAEDGDVVIKASNTKSAGTSDASFIKADNFHLYVATVSKTITSAGWATFCSPYALDLEHATGLTDAYIVTGGSTGVLTKTSVKDGTVPANTGLLLKGDAGTVTIPVVASSSTNVEANKLVGVNAATEIAANAGYVLMGSPSLGFYQNANVFTVGANTAYLPSNFDGSGARDFFRLEDDFTGINAIEAAEAEDGALKDGKYLIGNKIVLVKNGVKYSANGQILK